MFNKVKRNDGSMIPIFAMGIVIFVGMLAVIVDVGQLYAARSEINTAADAGSLAGASTGKRYVDVIYTREDDYDYEKERHEEEDCDTDPETGEEDCDTDVWYEFEEWDYDDSEGPDFRETDEEWVQLRPDEARDRALELFQANIDGDTPVRVKEVTPYITELDTIAVQATAEVDTLLIGPVANLFGQEVEVTVDTGWDAGAQAVMDDE